MKCVMRRGIYLRADGRLPCYCSSGEALTLGQLSREDGGRNFARDFYRGPSFLKIRDRMAQGVTPFPGVCEQCTYLDADGEESRDEEKKTIAWFHWEPSSLCQLDCLWCTKDRPIYDATHDVRLLDTVLFEQLVESLAAEGLRLEMGNCCGVGEPTTHPEVWRQVACVKKNLGGNILLSSNGQSRFHEEIVTCGLDKFKIAVDGIDQQTYERYRKRGKLDRILDLTQKVSEAKRRLGVATPRVIWQYILFNYNDSDREFLEYQKMAADHGVDELRIVFTRCHNYSLRNREDLPVTFPSVKFLEINQYSRIGSDEAATGLAEARRLLGYADYTAAYRMALKIVNRIHHRFALGVETYFDLIEFTRNIQHLRNVNLAALSTEEFEKLLECVTDGFVILRDAAAGMGFADEAEGYATYLAQLGKARV